MVWSIIEATKTRIRVLIISIQAYMHTYIHAHTKKTHLTGYLVTFLPDSAASLSVLTDSTASTASFAKNSDSGPCVCDSGSGFGGFGLCGRVRGP